MSEAILRKWNGLHREASQENFKDGSRQSLEMAAGTAAGDVLLTISSLTRFGVHSNQNAYEVCWAVHLFSCIGSE